MIISAIVAMDPTGLIGDGQAMPWHLPIDLRRFKALTMGKPLIMGRRTYQSLKAPLPGRLNIVLSRNLSLSTESPQPGCRFAGSIDDGLQIAAEYLETTGGDEVMIIGGGVVYDATVDLWDRLYLTVVEGQFAGVTHFPLGRAIQIPWRAAQSESHTAHERNPVAHRFVRLDRIPAPRATVVFEFERWLHSGFGDRFTALPDQREGESHRS